jgi:periplasmic divalent cation tolerance protein
MPTPRIVFITASSMEEGRKLAQAILDKRLAACVSIAPGMESRYWWNDMLETAQEVQLVIKSSAEHFEALAEVVRWHHSYKCPEIVAVTPTEMSPEYRAWWEAELEQASPPESFPFDPFRRKPYGQCPLWQKNLVTSSSTPTRFTNRVPVVCWPDC